MKPYVLRYWEQEFTQLKPMKRRGNRRYYQHHEVLLIRRIRELLYEQGFTISGARNRLTEAGQSRASAPDLTGTEAIEPEALLDNSEIVAEIDPAIEPGARIELPQPEVATLSVLSMPQMRQELLSIRVLLGG